MTDWILTKGDANQMEESTDTWTVSRAYLQQYDQVALPTVKAQEMYTYESCTRVYAFLLLTLRFRKNNSRSNTAEIRRL